MSVKFDSIQLSQISCWDESKRNKHIFLVANVISLFWAHNYCLNTIICWPCQFQRLDNSWNKAPICFLYRFLKQWLSSLSVRLGYSGLITSASIHSKWAKSISFLSPHSRYSIKWKKMIFESNPRNSILAIHIICVPNQSIFQFKKSLENTNICQLWRACWLIALNYF